MAGQCRICSCTEASACVVDGVQCSWANAERTLCTTCNGGRGHVAFKSSQEEPCPACARIVLTMNQAATGFIATCGRRLTRIEQCVAGGCEAAKPTPPADVWTAPQGLIVERGGERWLKLDDDTVVRIDALVRGAPTEPGPD